MSSQASPPTSANLFQELLETIQSLTGLRPVIYDRDAFTARAGRHAIDAAFSGHRSAFCALVRSTPSGEQGCQESDVIGATEEAAERAGPFLHVCHAGLMEVVMPVLYRGEQVATVFCGQCLAEGCPAEDLDWLAAQARLLGLDAREAARAQAELPRISQAKLVQIGKMLFLALNHLAETEGRAALERALALERRRPVRRAMAYIDQHFADSIRLDDVARVVHVTPAYFSRLFHKTTGATFVSYLTQRRIAEAKVLLKSTAMAMSDVAFAVGYGDQSYFGRKFKQVTGQTPSTFRKANVLEAKKPK